MIKVVVFNTKEECKEQLKKDYRKLRRIHKRKLKYLGITKRWARPRYRFDGKWDFKVMPGQTYTGLTIEDYNEDNYAEKAKFYGEKVKRAIDGLA